MYIKITDIKGAQDIIQDTGRQAEYYHTNCDISTLPINMAVMDTRRIRIANLPYELREDITGLASPVRENPISKGINMVTIYRLCCSRWHPTSGNDPHKTYSFPYNNRETPRTHMIPGPAIKLLRLRCYWAHVSCLPKQAWKE